MRPLTLTRPKQMILLGGRPLLEHIFESLPDEIEEVILVIGYLGEQIQDYFQDAFGRFRVRYVHQAEKLGTAHALGLCRDLLGDERFLMLYGDDLQSKRDISRCLRHPLSILVKEVSDPSRFGIVLADENMRVLDVIEKPENPSSNLASTGVKVLDGRIFCYSAHRHSNGEYYITDSLAQLAREHEVKAVLASFWLPIGYPEDLARAEEFLKKRATEAWRL